MREPELEDLFNGKTGLAQELRGCKSRWNARIIRRYAHRVVLLGQPLVPPILKGLATGDELKAVYHQRSKKVDERTITAGSSETLALKLRAEEKDGWAVLKRNKSSIRICKPKPVDRQLEDDVWSLLYRMGFSELNEDRQFAIQMGEDTEPRQLDVYARDDATVFIVECTHSQDVKSRPTMTPPVERATH